jgi:hypothetical protein
LQNFSIPDGPIVGVSYSSSLSMLTVKNLRKIINTLIIIEKLFKSLLNDEKITKKLLLTSLEKAERGTEAFVSFFGLKNVLKIQIN